MQIGAGQRGGRILRREDTELHLECGAIHHRIRLPTSCAPCTVITDSPCSSSHHRIAPWARWSRLRPCIFPWASQGPILGRLSAAPVC